MNVSLTFRMNVFKVKETSVDIMFGVVVSVVKNNKNIFYFVVFHCFKQENISLKIIDKTINCV